VHGSPGRALSRADATYEHEPSFGLDVQVTGRKAPTMINAAFAPQLFWDGRATSEFYDPFTNQLLLPFNAALESQALGPPLSTAEMGHLGRDLFDVAARVAASKPLALAESVPPPLAQWIGERSYPELFAEAFGTPEVTPARIALRDRDLPAHARLRPDAVRRVGAGRARTR
jgi:cytochrome c peroxidase